MKDICQKIHGSNTMPSVMIAAQGASEFMKSASNFPAQNPITASGGKVMESMQRGYGMKKGKQVFYASINKGLKGSKKWHK